ncbi:MAG: glycoside hydrolase, partial [Candidatus Hydrogenedentes bacterium]|nr:glycoside hydrolase [Candidatus Hydrogenedentota bacterium]
MYAMYAEHRDLTLKYGEKFGDYFDDFCNDPAVNDKLGNVLCAHSYRADRIPAQFIPQRMKFRAKFDEYPDWKYWMTEYCVMQGPDNEGGGGRDLTMKTALDVARVIHGDLTICNASAWQWWLAVSHYHYKDGLIYTDYGRDDVPGNEETIYPSKLLWVFGNYSRFVRPGFKRIELTGADDIYGLLGSAYKSPSGDEIVLVFINMAEMEKTVSLRLKGLPEGTAVKSFTPHVTSEQDDLKAYPPVNADAKYIVPPRSAVTLVGKLIAP